MRWIGAVLIIFCGAYFGFSMVMNHKKEENTFRQIICALDYMECELQYHLTPLPQLLHKASMEVNGVTGIIMADLAEELGNQILPEVRCCMEAALHKHKDISESCCNVLRRFGQCLGRFDLEGQLQELVSVRTLCTNHLVQLETDRDVRLRSYKTLGICAGTALAILLL